MQVNLACPLGNYTDSFYTPKTSEISVCKQMQYVYAFVWAQATDQRDRSMENIVAPSSHLARFNFVTF